ncbi:MAG: hypothetical protein ABUL72_00530, partial [Armatimonadota bacterium]
PSELRARKVLSEIKKLGSPVKRSLVSTSLRARVEPKDGGYELFFGPTEIHNFKGQDGAQRASDAISRVNDFLDTVPEMYHVTTASDGTFMGRGKVLFQVTSADANDLPESIRSTILSMRKAVYAVSMDASYSGRSG